MKAVKGPGREPYQLENGAILEMVQYRDIGAAIRTPLRPATSSTRSTLRRPLAITGSLWLGAEPHHQKIPNFRTRGQRGSYPEGFGDSGRLARPGVVIEVASNCLVHSSMSSSGGFGDVVATDARRLRTGVTRTGVRIIPAASHMPAFKPSGTLRARSAVLRDGQTPATLARSGDTHRIGDVSEAFPGGGRSGGQWRC